MRGADFGSPPASAETLVRGVARGDEEAVTRFYEQYADAVFRFVYRRVGGAYEDAEEITQDTFLAAVAYAGTFDGSCAPLTWLCGIAKLRVADFLRHRGRRKRVPPGALCSLDGGHGAPAGNASPAVWDRLELRQVLDRALAALRHEEREVLLLRYVEQFSIQEIATLIGRSEKAAESLLIRARKKAARGAAK